MNNDKIPIELTPYDALNLLAFLREFDYSVAPELTALGKSVDALENEVCRNMRPDQLQDAKAERAVNKLIGFEPNG